MERKSVKNKREYQRPSWLKVGLPSGKKYRELKDIIHTNQLHTVCEEARCPNISECWAAGTGTIMILGDTCTRSCGFCAIKTGRPPVLDKDEPKRVAESVRLMRLKHVVITSVNRDELKDGGARIWAETITEIRKANPTATIEALIPDFQGDNEAIDLVLETKPEILNHNIETAPRLYPTVRPQAKYHRSLKLLDYAKKTYGLTTKSGLMVGFGESNDEVREVLKDLRSIDCDIVTIGQYLQPTKIHLSVDRYVSPDEFESFKRTAESLGFKHIQSAPLVRSSYHAELQIAK
ncbi:lipoic acid synthetase [Chloroherpeton thalassium ATCC 35110]|uniref:Lipoyl synthase n=1 Tax=Chloroherpeton thalassium (strain ATCC 35110 / GB-78) TaxID=517418 RepID=B3QVZ8_CHLT3|nr:lipoyl synthase [Chloroherpeton thalassium]ACF14652.1 lipoic acid synthetase [Chloroherpeton thalassium ATCC 35110]